jgi:predicted methyltransferase
MESAINELGEAIKKIDSEIIQLTQEKQDLVNSREILYKVNGVCPDCCGSGYYYRKSDGNDPYERSSDLKEMYLRCNGTGKYNK